MGLWKDRPALTPDEMKERFGDAYTPPVNQCDGCRRGLVVRLSERGTLIHDAPNGMPVMTCTADRYRTSAANGEGSQ